MPSLTCKNCSSLVIYSDGMAATVCPKCGKEVHLSVPPTPDKLPVAQVIEAGPTRTGIEPGHKSATGLAPPAHASSAIPGTVHHAHPPVPHPARSGGWVPLIVSMTLGIVLASVVWLMATLVIRNKLADQLRHAAQIQTDLQNAKMQIEEQKQESQKDIQQFKNELQAQLEALNSQKDKLLKDRETLNMKLKSLELDKAKWELLANDLLYEGRQPSDGRRIRPGVPFNPPPKTPQ